MGHNFFYPPLAMFDTRPSKATSFVKQRPTVLDELPLDIIREYIFPCLDYDSRINLNLCLPPWDRLSKKMDRASVETHDRLAATATVKEYLKKLDWIWTPTDRYKLIIKMFSLFFKPRYQNMASYNLEFRRTIFERLDTMLESLKTPHKGHCGMFPDIDVAMRLLKTMKRLKRRLENTPYKGEVIDLGKPLVFV